MTGVVMTSAAFSMTGSFLAHAFQGQTLAGSAGAAVRARSPVRSPVTPGPAFSATPTPSCPRMRPAAQLGTAPFPFRTSWCWKPARSHRLAPGSRGWPAPRAPFAQGRDRRALSWISISRSRLRRTLATAGGETHTRDREARALTEETLQPRCGSGEPVVSVPATPLLRWQANHRDACGKARYSCRWERARRKAKDPSRGAVAVRSERHEPIDDRVDPPGRQTRRRIGSELPFDVIPGDRKLG